MEPVNRVDPVNQGNQPNNLRLIACPHVFSIEKDRIDRLVPAGGTVAEHLRAIGWTPEGLNARVFIDGELIEQAQWEYAVPRAGQSVVTRAIPMGGGGGGKDALRIVAMLGVIVAALAAPEILGAAGFWGAIIETTPGVGGVLSAAVSILGTLALSGLIPASLPRRALPQPVPQRQLQEAA